MVACIVPTLAHKEAMEKILVGVADKVTWFTCAELEEGLRGVVPAYMFIDELCFFDEGTMSAVDPLFSVCKVFAVSTQFEEHESVNHASRWSNLGLPVIRIGM